MRPFFNQDHLNIKILTYLDQNPSVTYTELATNLGYDRSTISDAVHAISTCITRHNIRGLTLAIHNHKINYHRDLGFNLATLLPYLTDRRLGDIFEQAFCRNRANITDLANQLYISPSTCRRLIKTVNLTLANYELKIDPKNVTIVGNEAKIRYAAFQCYWNTYGSVKWPFSSNLHELKSSDQHFHIQEFDRLLFAFWLAICRQRRLTGNLIKARELKTTASITEREFIQLICFVDFNPSINITNLVNKAPQWRSPKLQAVLQVAANNPFFRLVSWYAEVFANLPLLYDRSAYLTHYLTTYPTIYKRLKPLCKHNPMSIVTCFQFLVKNNSPLLKKQLNLALMIDSDWLTREVIVNQLSAYFNNVDFHITSSPQNAQLIITNLTQPASRVPVIYVEPPITISKLASIAKLITSVTTKKEQASS